MVQTFAQERIEHCTVEQIVDVLVPHVVERIGNQIEDVTAPQILENHGDDSAGAVPRRRL